MRNSAAARLARRTDHRGPVSPERKIDALDRRIIEALQENGRESFRRIAARVGVLEATIRARYARLTEDDILQVVGVTSQHVYENIQHHASFDYIQHLLDKKNAHVLGPIPSNLFLFFGVNAPATSGDHDADNR